MRFLTFLLALAFPAVVVLPAATSRDFQQRATELIQAHKEAPQRLDVPVAATLHALLDGKKFFVGTGDSWGSEAVSRAAGLAGPDAYQPGVTHRGDVVWLEYDQKSWKDTLKIATAVERSGCLVVLFGPKPAGGEPFHLWVDSLNARDDDAALNLLANVLSLWEANGELIAAASQNGKRLAVNVTYLLPEAKQNPAVGTVFDSRRPPLDPIPSHVMAAEYLSAVEGMFRDIDQKESQPLAAAAALIAANLRARKKIVYTAVGHLMQLDSAHSSRRFVYVKSFDDSAAFELELGKGGVLIYLGYVPGEQPFDPTRDLRKAGVAIVWSGVPPSNLSSWLAPGEIFIDQHWQLGDCGVRDHGSPCMLAVSGLAELYLFERLRDLTGDSKP
jgi:hypothetical protein